MYVILTCIFELLWIYGFNAAENWFHFSIIAVIIVTDFYFLEKACEDRNGLRYFFRCRYNLHGSDGHAVVSC